MDDTCMLILISSVLLLYYFILHFYNAYDATLHE